MQEKTYKLLFWFIILFQTFFVFLFAIEKNIFSLIHAPLVVIQLCYLYSIKFELPRLNTKALFSFALIHLIFALFNSIYFYSNTEFYNKYFVIYSTCFSLVTSIFYFIICYFKLNKTNDGTEKIISNISKYTIIPISFYLLFTFFNNTDALLTTFLALVLALVILFLIFSVSYFIQNSATNDNLKKLRPWSYFLLVTILPTLGLFTNRSISIAFNFNDLASYGGVFGDFTHWTFYFIVILNGIVLSLPKFYKVTNNKIALALFYLKSVGICFIIYFCFAMLSGIAFAAILIFFIIGLLAFLPYIIFYFQSRELYQDYKSLKNFYSSKKLILILLLGLFTLPSIVYANMLLDSSNYKKALTFLDQYSDHSINLTRLERSLGFMSTSYDKSLGFGSHRKYEIPIISYFYRVHVLGYRNLSHNNYMLMNSIFFNRPYDTTNEQISVPSWVKNNVKISKIEATTSYDTVSSLYKSYVHLELLSENDNNNEFSTTFYLPDGAYIDNYYLDVLGQRKQGLLTDRRAALFMYQEILNTRLDPGIITYIGANELMLRVFPFAPNELRKTGFEIIHKDSFSLKIGNTTIELKGGELLPETNVNGAVLLSSSKIKSLPTLKRKPEYYFIIDASSNSDISYLENQLNSYADKYKIDNATVYLTSYKFYKRYLIAKDDKSDYSKGGFNLNLAVRDIYKNHSSNTYPVIFVLSENILNGVRPYNIFPFVEKYPESSCYYLINNDLTLTPYSFGRNEKFNISDEPIINIVKDYNNIPVIHDGSNKIILTSQNSNIPLSSRFENAIQLFVNIRNRIISDEQPTVDDIRNSFRLGILTYDTAFIVVETEAQERELLDIQNKILNDEDLSNSSPTETLAEPNIFSVLLVILVFIIIKKSDLSQNLSGK